jgi:hypothetical protein
MIGGWPSVLARRVMVPSEPHEVAEDDRQMPFSSSHRDMKRFKIPACPP